MTKHHSNPFARHCHAAFLLSLLVFAPAHGFAEAPQTKASSVEQGTDSKEFGTQDERENVRIKDIARIQGVRSNQLVGYGLVVGLQGSGDSPSSLSTSKSAANLLTRLGSLVTPDQVSTKNIASVIVTAELPPFAKIGDRIQVRISSVGDAKSLSGGSLILTPLRAADNETYAIAQGHISLGAALAGASGGAASESNIKTIALSEGGTVEKEFASGFIQKGQINLSLKEADFTTASRVAQSINLFYGSFLATALNAAHVQVKVPTDVYENASFQLVDFVAALEQIRLTPDRRAKVVINERTGTIIMGSEVRIAPVAISHGFLEIEIEDSKGRIGNIKGGNSLGELVRSLNALGTGPKDLVSILQALSKSGALSADLVFM